MPRSSKDIPQHRKLALLIGNRHYSRSENRRDQANRNTRDLAQVLESIDFGVVIVDDLSRHDMFTCVISFCEKIQDGDFVLFYFCGHGCQVANINYLIPIGDDQIDIQDDVKRFAVECDAVLEYFIENNRSYVTVVILDCAQPYLLRRAPKSSSLIPSEGLGRISLPTETFIQLASSPNQTDGDDRHSDSSDVFIKHLLQNISQENVSIVDTFQRITEGVYRETGKQQKPVSMNGLRRHASVCLNFVEIPVEEWDMIEPSKLEEVEKKQVELRACYDNFPDIEELTHRDKASVQRAETLTQTILNKTPSGDVTAKDTACHVIYKLFEQEGQECLFFDSKDSMTLHDASGGLADLDVQDKPFVLKLNSLDGLGDKRYANGGEHNINAVEQLQHMLDQKQSHPVINDIVARLAKAHKVDKKHIIIKRLYLGSGGVVYTVDDLPQNVVKSLTNISDRLKDQFEQFRSAKIYPLLYRPAFDISQFDDRGNKTFVNQGTSQIGPRGREETYYPPNGWTRYGLNVLDRYERKEWLEPFQNPGNWYRAYHGTGRATAADFGKPDSDLDKQYVSVDAMPSIHDTGFRKARKTVYGEGVYCSPNPAFPVNDYVTPVSLDTKQGKKNFKCMLQVAVNPDGVKFTEKKDIWVAKQPKDIRAYGILIKEV